MRPMHRLLLETTESSHDTTGRAGSIWDISFSSSATAGSILLVVYDCAGYCRFDGGFEDEPVIFCGPQRAIRSPTCSRSLGRRLPAHAIAARRKDVVAESDVRPSANADGPCTTPGRPLVRFRPRTPELAADRRRRAHGSRRCPVWWGSARPSGRSHFSDPKKPA